MKLSGFIVMLCLAIGTTVNAQTKKTAAPQKPSGMFMMEGAKCAGLKFNSETSATFINEIGCAPWELKLRWIDNDTFVLVEQEQQNESCPPRVLVFDVVSFDGKTLKLKEYWAGWGYQKDQVTTYHKE